MATNKKPVTVPKDFETKIDKLIVLRFEADSLLRQANTALYGVLGKCKMLADATDKKILVQACKDRKIDVKASSHLYSLILYIVFSDISRQKVSAYAAVLKKADEVGLKDANQVATWIAAQGGIEAIRTGRNEDDDGDDEPSDDEVSSDEEDGPDVGETSNAVASAEDEASPEQAGSSDADAIDEGGGTPADTEDLATERSTITEVEPKPPQERTVAAAASSMSVSEGISEAPVSEAQLTPLRVAEEFLAKSHSGVELPAEFFPEMPKGNTLVALMDTTPQGSYLVSFVSADSILLRSVLTHFGRLLSTGQPDLNSVILSNVIEDQDAELDRLIEHAGDL